ncbi:protein PLASTID REDOX INSENSITIVE 2, chloroplastic-like isoform X2 [Silene latifolia]|uniref:protein PLASTID REDOX INSENSITIVE 2, chloroplastic-like isoform X2 n=1 Tax=Silene latifolia TaxID=37657 RepID=UPI003D76D249
MASHTCSHLIIPSIFPAKFPTVNFLILRTPSLILRIPSHSTRRTRSRSFSIPSLNGNSTQKYVYPDPIPAFADAENQKFKIALRKTLLKDEDVFGDELDEVVDVCAKAEIWLRRMIGGAIVRKFILV